MKLLVILTILPIFSTRTTHNVNFSDRNSDICNPGGEGYSDCQFKNAKCIRFYNDDKKQSHKCECSPGKSFSVEGKCVGDEICSPESLEYRLCSSGNAKCEKDKNKEVGYKCVCQKGEYINDTCKEPLTEEMFFTETPIEQPEKLFTKEPDKFSEKPEEYSTKQPNEFFSEKPDEYSTEEPDKYSTEELDEYSTEKPDKYSTEELDEYTTENPDKYSTEELDEYSTEEPDKYSTEELEELSSKQSEEMPKFEISTKPVENTNEPEMINTLIVENNSTDDINNLNFTKYVGDVELYKNKSTLDKNHQIMIIGVVLGMLILTTIFIIVIIVYRKKKFQNSKTQENLRK